MILDSFLGEDDDDDFDETPVELDKFLYDKKFLGLSKPLSDIQFDVVERGSQIFKLETLKKLYPKHIAEAKYKNTTKDILLALGKGCHAPYTPVYNAENGRWVELDTLKDSEGYVVGLTSAPEFRTESFYEGTGKMLRITTELGLVEDVYVGHKYWGMKQKDFYKRNKTGKTPEDIRADELKPGDRIMVGINMPVLNEISIGKDKAWILGVLLGDGHMPGQLYDSGSNNKLSIDFGGDEKESLSRYLSIVTGWGDKPSVKNHTNKNMVTVIHYAKNSPMMFALVAENNMRGKNAESKEIPDVVWSLPREELYEFIAGMFQTDGSVYFKKNGSRGSWIAEWCSISKKMAYGFQKLMLRAGIPASIRSKTPHYTYKGEYKTGKIAYVLTVSGQDKISQFNDKIVLTDYKQDRQQLVREHKVPGRKPMRIEGNLYADKVKKIESIPDGDYWSLTNPESAHYVGNGLVSRNSGKDFLSQLICCYVVYKLLCLKDPAEYYGLNSGEAIDIVNMAINANQAKRVFFNGLVNRVRRAPWFQGKYTDRQNDIAFDKSITVYSLHSSYEAAEGLNIFIAVLDEIDGFPVAGQPEAIYKALSGTVTSRHPKFGKVITLSFPRSKDGFILSKYEDAVIDREVSEHEHTFKLNDQLEDGAEGNEFTIHWTEEIATGYKYDNFYALKAPTFRVNPTKDIEDYKMAFYNDEEDALMRVCANPPESQSNAFFKNHEKLELAFNQENVNLWDKQSQELIGYGEPDFAYYIHIDLSKVRDRTVVSMGHVSKWLDLNLGGIEMAATADIVIDLIRVWEPSTGNSVDHGEVMDFVIELTKRFNVEWVTFDQWGSMNLIEYLTSIGIPAEKKSLSKPDYMEFLRAVQEYRIHGPHLDIFMDELKHLVYTKDGRVDHPKKNHNDISEAVCGVVRNCLVKQSPDSELEIVTYSTLKQKRAVEEALEPIKPKGPMPPDIEEWLRVSAI